MLRRPRSASSAMIADALDAYRAERAGIGAEPPPNLFGFGWPRPRQLRGTQLVIAAQQHQQRLALLDKDQALDLRGRRQSRKRSNVRDGLDAGSVKFFRLQVSVRVGNARRLCYADGAAEQRGVTGSTHQHFVARFRLHHEVVARPDVLHAAAFERPAPVVSCRRIFSIFASARRPKGRYSRPRMYPARTSSGCCGSRRVAMPISVHNIYVL